MKNFMFRLKMEHQGVEIISGGAKDGADKYAKRYALEFGLPYSEFPPQHDPHNIHCVMEAYNYGKPYGVGYFHKRNKDMVKYSDRVVAFCKDGEVTNGTKSTLEYCKKFNKKFIILD
jgi:predicted Rossmann-fold nucleotide-binding protein